VTGQHLLAEAVARFPTACAVILISGRSVAGLRVERSLQPLPDTKGIEGPAAGLVAALRWAKTHGISGVLFTPCDTPLVTTDLLQQFLAAWRSDTKRPCVAHDGERMHPLLGVVPSACVGRLETLTAQGERRAHALIAACQPQLLHPDHPEQSLMNLNHPHDLATWRRLAAGRDEPNVMSVLLFGPAAEAVGRRAAHVKVSEDTLTVAELRARLNAEVPHLAPWLAGSRLAVNHEFASEDQAVTAEDEIALIAQVSGG